MNWEQLLDELATTSDGTPLDEQTIQRVEARLGFALPKQLRELYLRAGNGGFGPGMLRLTTDREPNPKETFDSSRFSGAGLPFVSKMDEWKDSWDSVLGLYECWVNAPTDPVYDYPWPKSLLPIRDYGCAIYFCADIATPDLRVVEYEYLPFDKADEEMRHEHWPFAFQENEMAEQYRYSYLLAAPSLFEWLLNDGPRAKSPKSGF